MMNISVAPIMISIFCIGVCNVNAQSYQSAFALQQATFQNLMSATSVNVSATDTAQRQKSLMKNQSLQATSYALDNIKNNAEIASTIDNYSYQTGNGYKSCLVVGGQNTIGNAKAFKNTYSQTITNRDNTWFTDGGEQRETLSALIGLRKKIYCSQSEQKSMGDYCKKSGGFASGNSNASIWLAQRGYGAEEAMTGMDFVETVSPLPSIPKPNTGQADKEVARNNAIFKGAFVSAARMGITQTILNGMEDTTEDVGKQSDVFKNE